MIKEGEAPKVHVIFGSEVQIDAQTRRDGATAVKQFEDERTRMYFGPLQAAVDLRDLRIQVVMNPDPGPWEDPVRARNMALNIVAECLDEVLAGLVKIHFERGREEGRLEVQRRFLEVLGVR